MYQRKYKIFLKFKYHTYKILSPLFKPSHIMCLLVLKVEFISNTNTYSALYNALDSCFRKVYLNDLIRWD